MVDGDAEPLAARGFADQAGDVVEDLAEGEVLVFEDDLARLDLRQVQDVVDDGQQVPAGGVDPLQAFGLLRGGVVCVEHAARVPLMVDATLVTPALQCPIDLSADLVMHSATKFLGGHGVAIVAACSWMAAASTGKRRQRTSPP